MEAFGKALLQELGRFIPDAQQGAQLLVRLLVAGLAGVILGWNRERRDKAAGLRTHLLVVLGTAFFVLLPLQAGTQMEHLTRVIQGVAAGIGFLGAGAILKLTEQREVRGLTTAANIWLSAAVGVAAGLGMPTAALLGALLGYLILAAMQYLERDIPKEPEGEASREKAEQG